MGIESERKRPFPLFDRIMGGLNSGADLENYIGGEERGKKGSTGLKKTSYSPPPHFQLCACIAVREEGVCGDKLSVIVAGRGDC